MYCSFWYRFDIGGIDGNQWLPCLGLQTPCSNSCSQPAWSLPDSNHLSMEFVTWRQVLSYIASNIKCCLSTMPITCIVPCWFHLAWISHRHILRIIYEWMMACQTSMSLKGLPWAWCTYNRTLWVFQKLTMDCRWVQLCHSDPAVSRCAR